MDWHVEKRDKEGRFIGIVSGAGRNKGTWDSAHSRSSAYRIARELNARGDGFSYQATND